MSNIVDTNDRNYELAVGLSTLEFKCKCGRNRCHFFVANTILLEQYAKLRTEYAFPIKINSGFRCQGHNEGVGGVEKSRHTLGRALDLSTRGLSDYNKETLTDLAKKYFPFVKEYENFIHVDVR